MTDRKTLLASLVAAAAFAGVQSFADEPPPPPPPNDDMAPSLKATDGKQGLKGLREMGEQFKGQHPGGQEMDFGGMKRFLEQNLSEEEKLKLKRLAFDNPDAFREEMKKKFVSFNQHRQEEKKKLSGLQQKYREAATPEARKEAEEQIRAFTKEQFNQKMEMNKRRLDEAERNVEEASKRLDEYRKRFEERKAKANEIIEERVKELVKDPSLDWRD